MTATTTDTATTARIARVSVTTIRAWARIGAVAATKTGRGWVVDLDSLARRVILGRTLRAERTADLIDLSEFRDAKAARSKALDLISEGGIVPASRQGLYLAVSSDGTATYAIDTLEPSCTCKGAIHTGRCFHLVAANLLDGRARKAA